MSKRKHSQETKRKISKAMKGNTHNIGRKLSETHKKQISETKTGVTHSNAWNHAEAIRAEYATSKTTQKTLATKYNTSLRTIARILKDG